MLPLIEAIYPVIYLDSNVSNSNEASTITKVQSVVLISEIL